MIKIPRLISNPAPYRLKVAQPARYSLNRVVPSHNGLRYVGHTTKISASLSEAVSEAKFPQDVHSEYKPRHNLNLGPQLQRRHFAMVLRKATPEPGRGHTSRNSPTDDGHGSIAMLPAIEVHLSNGCGLHTLTYDLGHRTARYRWLRRYTHMLLRRDSNRESCEHLYL